MIQKGIKKEMDLIILVVLVSYCGFVLYKRYKQIKNGEYCGGNCCGCGKKCKKQKYLSFYFFYDKLKI